jgi:hypothetical protein
MVFDLVLGLKLLGVFFFIFMTIYFIYIVFDTNKDFLSSIRNEILDKKDSNIEGFFVKGQMETLLNDGFVVKRKTILEDILTVQEGINGKVKAWLQISGETVPGSKDLIKKILKTKRQNAALLGTYMLVNGDKKDEAMIGGGSFFIINYIKALDLAIATLDNNGNNVAVSSAVAAASSGDDKGGAKGGATGMMR